MGFGRRMFLCLWQDVMDSVQLAGELLFWSNWDSHQNGGKYNHEQGLGRNRRKATKKSLCVTSGCSAGGDQLTR